MSAKACFKDNCKVSNIQLINKNLAAVLMDIWKKIPKKIKFVAS